MNNVGKTSELPEMISFKTLQKFYDKPWIEDTWKIIRFPWTEAMIATDVSDSVIDMVIPYIEKYHDAYKQNKCLCICECSDATLFKDGVGIWQNGNTLKLFFDKEKMYGEVHFHADRCPICGRILSKDSVGTQSNGMLKI